MSRYILSTILISLATLLVLPAGQQKGRVTLRTENYPRPPYSGATYYITNAMMKSSVQSWRSATNTTIARSRIKRGRSRKKKTFVPENHTAKPIRLSSREANNANMFV